MARWRRLLAQLGRHQVGSLVATGVDFGTMILLVEAFGRGAVTATVVGASFGALTNFTLGRSWIFRATSGPMLPQAVRYVAVSGTSLALNALGEHALWKMLGLNYVLARIIVAGLVSLLWNFPMQRFFVFRIHTR